MAAALPYHPSRATHEAPPVPKLWQVFVEDSTVVLEAMVLDSMELSPLWGSSAGEPCSHGGQFLDSIHFDHLLGRHQFRFVVRVLPGRGSSWGGSDRFCSQRGPTCPGVDLFATIDRLV